MAATSIRRNPGQVIADSLMGIGKLGLGTMTHPETERWIARVVLFAHMEKMMRGDLKLLRESCLLHYRKLYDIGRAKYPNAPRIDVPILGIQERTSPNTVSWRTLHVENWTSLCEAAKHLPEAKELADALSNWAADRHMMADWFLDVALMNLCRWHKQPESAQTLEWSQPGSLINGKFRRGGIDIGRLHGWNTLDHVIPVPQVKPYNPSAQTREQHWQELDAELTRYYDEQEDVFAKEGFQKTVLKRARVIRGRPWLHFEWFIRYQMQDQSGSEIAKKYNLQGIGEDAIHRALGVLARILQVPLRPAVKSGGARLKKKKLKS